MAKNERLNEEAALNNNLNSSTLQMNHEIKGQQQQPKTGKQRERNNIKR